MGSDRAFVAWRAGQHLPSRHAASGRLLSVRRRGGHTPPSMNHIARRSRSLPAPPAALAGGALLGAVAGALAQAGWSGVAVGIVVGSIGAVAALVDIRERRIPDEVVLAGLVAAVTIVVVVSIASAAGRGIGARRCRRGRDPARWSSTSSTRTAWGSATSSSARCSARWWASSPGCSGLLLLAVASAIALIGVALLRSWRRSIPFGACLAGGALVVLAGAGWLADTWSLR